MFEDAYDRGAPSSIELWSISRVLLDVEEYCW